MKKLLLHAWHKLVWIVLLSIDVTLNRIFNGRVETISSRAGRARSSGRRWGCWLCAVLDKIQPEHCANAQKDPTGGL